jgi:hypothetical protein
VTVILVCVALLVVLFLVKQHQNDNSNNTANVAMNDTTRRVSTIRAGHSSAAAVFSEDVINKSEAKKLLHAKRKYLMLLGILVASVTYDAGLAPPGGAWQKDDIAAGDNAGDPVMHDNRRTRYFAIFYSNSTSFVASIVVIFLLLTERLQKERWWLGVMNTTVVLDLLGLVVAYAAGSSRASRTSVKVSALVMVVLACFVIHVGESSFVNKRRNQLPVNNVM